MAIYVAIILGGSFYLNTLDTVPIWMNATLAIASALPVIAVLFIMLRYVSETDEYTRLTQLKAMAYGATIVFSAIFIVGFLQMFDVIETFQVFWFGPAYFFAYGVSSFLLGGRDC